MTNAHSGVSAGYPGNGAPPFYFGVLEAAACIAASLLGIVGRPLLFSARAGARKRAPRLASRHIATPVAHSLPRVARIRASVTRYAAFDALEAPPQIDGFAHVCDVSSHLHREVVVLASRPPFCCDFYMAVVLWTASVLSPEDVAAGLERLFGNGRGATSVPVAVAVAASAAVAAAVAAAAAARIGV